MSKVKGKVFDALVVGAGFSGLYHGRRRVPTALSIAEKASGKRPGTVYILRNKRVLRRSRSDSAPTDRRHRIVQPRV